MVDLLPARRRAEEFARALDEAEPAHAPRLEPLLATVSALRSVPPVEPGQEFRLALRERLLAAAADALPSPATTPEGTPPVTPPTDDRRPAGSFLTPAAPVALRRRSRLVAAATGMVLLGGGTGAAAASEQALPGDVLYPVKRTLERVELALAGSDREQGRALVEQAATRLAEIDALSKAGGAATELDDISTTLDDFTADLEESGRLLLASYADTGDASALQILRAFTSRSGKLLRGLDDRLPAELQPALRRAAESLVAVDGAAIRSCPECTASAPPLDVRTVLVPLSDRSGSTASYATSNPAAPRPQTTPEVAEGVGARAAGPDTAKPDTASPDTGARNVDRTDDRNPVGDSADRGDRQRGTEGLPVAAGPALADDAGRLAPGDVPPPPAPGPEADRAPDLDTDQPTTRSPSPEPAPPSTAGAARSPEPSADPRAQRPEAPEPAPAPGPVASDPPELPESPERPQAPEQPERPESPELPHAPQVSGTTAGAPSEPPAPRAPDVPDSSDVPNSADGDDATDPTASPAGDVPDTDEVAGDPLP